jgi:hypothetical protein
MGSVACQRLWSYGKTAREEVLVAGCCTLVLVLGAALVAGPKT